MLWNQSNLQLYLHLLCCQNSHQPGCLRPVFQWSMYLWLILRCPPVSSSCSVRCIVHKYHLMFLSRDSARLGQRILKVSIHGGREGQRRVWDGHSWMGGGPWGPEVLWEEGCSSSLSNPPSRASIFFPLSLGAVVLGNETQLLLSVAHGRSPCCCLNTTN